MSLYQIETNGTIATIVGPKGYKPMGFLNRPTVEEAVADAQQWVHLLDKLSFFARVVRVEYADLTAQRFCDCQVFFDNGEGKGEGYYEHNITSKRWSGRNEPPAGGDWVFINKRRGHYNPDQMPDRPSGYEHQAREMFPAHYD